MARLAFGHLDTLAMALSAAAFDRQPTLVFASVVCDCCHVLNLAVGLKRPRLVVGTACHGFVGRICIAHLKTQHGRFH